MIYISGNKDNTIFNPDQVIDEYLKIYPNPIKRGNIIYIISNDQEIDYVIPETIGSGIYVVQIKTN
jgi:hypothetical protein